MQLFALTASGKWIDVRQAIREVDYHCPECGAKLRLRAGSERRHHFFHLSKGDCRQAGKTAFHIQVQERLAKLLPKGEAHLEVPFPRINRIADLCWEAKKIIFEVQCSSISDREVAARNRDYESLGFTVVWILHERSFNKKKMSRAERWLWDRLHFFTNIDTQGRGEIFDQPRILRGIQSIRRLPRSRVDLAKPRLLPKGSLPKPLRRRTLSFAGDAFEQPHSYSMPKRRNLYQRFFQGLLRTITENS